MHIKHGRDENINMANLQMQPEAKHRRKLIHIPREYLSTFSTRGSDFFLIICKSFLLYVIHDQSYFTYIVQLDNKINHFNE